MAHKMYLFIALSIFNIFGFFCATAPKKNSSRIIDDIVFFSRTEAKFCSPYQLCSWQQNPINSMLLLGYVID